MNTLRSFGKEEIMKNAVRNLVRIEEIEKKLFGKLKYFMRGDRE